MKLKNKIAVITGAGRGIGRSIALAFADEGADVVLTARTPEQLKETAMEIENKGRKALPIPCDVSLPKGSSEPGRESPGRIRTPGYPGD